ncbi:serine/threonine-protein kinase 17A isoform X2 [Protopterus annectens]|uniref:serine/threonine-protein kinase 17A isoform X2 n=1 Tax=Protopterus annectens TaxID=7888 RepID=UPI001CFBFF13|nr:serine/threonine-protein kinase 17A isoform X2 [Protopterus annectens]
MIPVERESRRNESLSRSQYRPPPRPGLLGEIHCPIRSDPFSDRYLLVPGQELGRGKFAVVKKCVEKTTEKEYAAKFMRKRRRGQDCRVEILHEVAVLELAISNLWVINLHEVYETPSEIILVLEYAAGGEIFNRCIADQEDAFKEKDVKRLMRQILQGLSFLHSNNVVHLDIKPQNILLTSSFPLGDIRIVDFGLSRIINKDKELREIMGTPEYVAPEILNYEPISSATDMWSVGVVAYVMLTGTSPFLGDDKQETFLNISQMNVSYSGDIFEGISDAAIEFVKSLLIKDPRDRISAEKGLQHPWLKDDSESDTSTSYTSENTEEVFLGTSQTELNAPFQEEDDAPCLEKAKFQDPVTEELVVVASYTLGQCRQSENESITSDPKGISKRFKFEEPFSTLQELTGEFIY